MFVMYKTQNEKYFKKKKTGGTYNNFKCEDYFSRFFNKYINIYIYNQLKKA